jgi:hypothetical protein
MKREIKLVSAVGALFLLIAGCGGTDGDMPGGGGDSDGGGGGGGNSDGGGGGGGNDPCQGPVVPYGDVAGGHSVDTDETWTADKVYFVFGRQSIGGNTLTIEAGTTVCFANGMQAMTMVAGSIDVDTGGSIRMLGTSDKHVTLRDGAGGWEGIHAGSDYKELTFKNVDFVGATTSGSFAISTTSGLAPAITAENVTFTDSHSAGVKIENLNGFTPASKLTFVSMLSTVAAENQVPVVYMDVEAASHLTAGQIVVQQGVPARVAAVYLSRNYVGKDMTLRKLSVPYRTLGLEIYGANASDPVPALTIEAGTTVQVYGDPIFMGGRTENGVGDLIAVGTAADPIVFTSSENAPMAGDWSSLVFWPGYFNPQRSKLDHVRIENAGSQSPQSSVDNCHDAVDHKSIGAAVLIPYQSGDVLIEGPAITNTAFKNILGEAVRGFCATPTHCLAQDYTLAALGNTFTNIVSGVNQATTGGSCK